MAIAVRPINTYLTTTARSPTPTDRRFAIGHYGARNHLLAGESSRLDDDGLLNTSFENYESASPDRVSFQPPESGDVLDGRRRKYPSLLPFMSLTDPDLPPGHPYIKADLTCGASDCNN
ncbi:hypothetical protein AC578_9960 [Pseudocercospora eumusae]|uniref:Uncharacterized protein n=1 Tax=Pseudocercospora eumusae TaxID=321146 RepID=A0A139GVJ2_9PEZI|nr:hypothetical protein AC578_9960 [Pseudocercospora eumusae]